MENQKTAITSTPSQSLQIAEQTPIERAISEINEEDRRAVTFIRNHIKVKDFSPSDLVQLDARIMLWVKYLGITDDNKPTTKEVEVVSDFIKKHYSDFALDEIMYAFELNLTGALGVTVESFQKINLPYVTKILNAYKAYRQKKLIIDERIKAEKKAAEFQKMPTPEEIEARQEGCYLKLIEFVQDNEKLPQFWGWTDVYLYMDRSGLVKLTLDQRKAVFELTKKEHLKSLENLKLRDYHEWKREVSALEKNLPTICREEFVKGHFQKMIDA